MSATPLLDWTPPIKARGLGATYDPAKDGKRLRGKLLRVFEFMKDGHWHTLEEITKHTGVIATSASARIRQLDDYRWPHERLELSPGLYAYRIYEGEPQRKRRSLNR